VGEAPLANCLSLSENERGHHLGNDVFVPSGMSGADELQLERVLEIGSGTGGTFSPKLLPNSEFGNAAEVTGVVIVSVTNLVPP